MIADPDACIRCRGTGREPGLIPWHPDWWKPSADRIGELAKAGALIAAEIDRLERSEVTP